MYWMALYPKSRKVQREPNHFNSQYYIMSLKIKTLDTAPECITLLPPMEWRQANIKTLCFLEVPWSMQFHWNKTRYFMHGMHNNWRIENDDYTYTPCCSDPDNYRFRVANLPDNISHAPHSQSSSPILLNTGETGDLARTFDAAILHHAYRTTNTFLKGTDAHIGLLSALYSPK